MNFKKNKNIMYAVSVLFAALSLQSCEEKEPIGRYPIPESEKAYEIFLDKESDFYSVEVQEEATAGVEVSVKVTPVENVFIDKVKYNTGTAEKVSDTEYKFIMPEKKVKISVQISSTVTVEKSSYFSGWTDKEIAKTGEIVTVTFNTLYADDIVSRAVVNGTLEGECISADLGEYVYEFLMPEGPAVVVGYTQDEYHIIEREWDEHSHVWMLDCINHQGTPEEFCSQAEGKLVHFLYKCDLGYDVECKVIGKNTGTDYTGEVLWSLAADNHLYQDCWAFLMPDEPVVIKATSTERSVYEGQEFVGTYSGYLMELGENRIITSTEPGMLLNLSKNGAYDVKSDDVNKYDFAGIYTVTDNKISYNPENGTGDYAIAGTILENSYVFIVVEDLIENKINNARFYLAGKEGFKYTCATDTDYATRFVVEADNSGSKSWYFVERDTKSVKVLSVEFISGSSLSEDCEAIMSIEGTPYLKYTYVSGSTPVITYCGKEAGRYVSTNGDELNLDGFGRGSYNAAEGSYTIDAGLVTFTDKDGNVTKFNIDFNNHTFTVISEPTDIVLDPAYSTDTAWIYVESGEPYQGGHVLVKFESDYNGNYKEGYALIKITYMDTGREKEMIGASCPYFIDEDTRSITISNVLQGSGSGWSTVRKDIVLNISEDYKTLTFAADTIVSTSSPYIYCFGGDQTTIVSERAEQ